MSAENSTTVSIVPWYNAAQFKTVYEYLYSEEINKKKWAYETISVWETRCHPSLPTAIEATYVLTSAVIQDILWTNKASLIHHTDLQGIYGSAITRFVSLTVEVNKKKDVPTYSVAEVAKSIGIPTFIVDIRNEWCHSGRPSLSFLRLGAKSALEYLKKSYWEKEADRVCNYVKQPLDETELRSLFQEYIQFHSDELLSKKEKVLQSGDTAMKMNPEYYHIIRKLEKYLKHHKRLFIKVLVSEGIFIPSDEDFKDMVSEEEYKLFNHEYTLDDDEEDYREMCDVSDYADSIQFEAKNLPEIPHYHENLWENVIALLNKYEAVPFLMESLLESQGNRTLIGQKLLIAWILIILRLHSVCGFAAKSRSLKKIFRRKGIVMNSFRLLHSAAVNPCKYTLVVLPLILNKLDIRKEVAIRISGLISLKLGLIYHEGLKGNYHKLFHTVDDLKEALKNQRNYGKKPSVENIWSPCPDDSHKLWPIGDIVNMIKEEEEEIFDTLESIPEQPGFIESNENEDDDDGVDQDDRINDEEPDMKRIMMEVEKRKSLLYHKI